jgi:hypothetical protein
MTLTDIKNKMVERLCMLTIDDFYSNPDVSFLKDIFTELTNQKTDDQILEYLTTRIPETTIEGKRLDLEFNLTELEDKLVMFQSLIKDFQIDYDTLELQIAEKKEIQTNIPNLEKKAREEQIEIESEIQQLKPLATKAPYIDQITALENTRLIKIKEIASYPIELKKLEDEISELQVKRNEALINIQKNNLEILDIQLKIDNTKKDLENLDGRINHYEDEFSSLNFLCRALLNSSFGREVTKLIKTNKKIYENGKYNDEYVISKTGKIILAIEYSSIEESRNFIISFTKNKSVIPIGWRKLLYQVLSNPLPNLSGTISHKLIGDKSYFQTENLELTDEDISALLAVKIAVSSNYSVKTADNKIILGLSGGLSATIVFREKGDLISKFQKHPFEIFSNCILSERYVNQTLYNQTGYANSTISIETAGAFYILVDKFVIEIYFNPAPILFDTNNLVRFSPNISGKARREDQIEEANERIRLQVEDDDYY